MALMPPTVRERLLAELRRLGLLELLGSTLFALLNWHQPLSDRFGDDPKLIERLLSVGAMISARVTRLRFDRIESGQRGHTHRAFKPDMPPADFDALPQCVRTTISTSDHRKRIKPRST